MNINKKLHKIADLLSTHGYQPKFVAISEDFVRIDEATFRKMFPSREVRCIERTASIVDAETEWEGYKWRSNLWIPERKPKLKTVQL